MQFGEQTFTLENVRDGIEMKLINKQHNILKALYRMWPLFVCVCMGIGLWTYLWVIGFMPGWALILFTIVVMCMYYSVVATTYEIVVEEQRKIK